LENAAVKSIFTKTASFKMLRIKVGNGFTVFSENTFFSSFQDTQCAAFFIEIIISDFPD